MLCSFLLYSLFSFFALYFSALSVLLLLSLSHSIKNQAFLTCTIDIMDQLYFLHKCYANGTTLFNLPGLLAKLSLKFQWARHEEHVLLPVFINLDS